MDNINIVVEEILNNADVKKIILISKKIDVQGGLQSFKLCVVVETDNVSQTEEQLYMQIDCDINFDLILYNTADWERLSKEHGAFAWKIKQTGAVLYGGAE
ncbi:MAG: hypothetical protein LBM93_05390 [Oscillospiraceae bacterium]|jgi:hypothetical protein|nr:hypothetical protein [Oscillospiraceae bacterium]